MEVPVLVPVAAGSYGAELEDGFRHGESPSRPGDAETILDEVAASALDDARGDGQPVSWFTYDFEEQVAYLAQKVDKTTLSALMRIAWRTVGAIIERVVPRHRKGDPLDDLTRIGVDELSYRRHHEYVTVVIGWISTGGVHAATGRV